MFHACVKDSMWRRILKNFAKFRNKQALKKGGKKVGKETQNPSSPDRRHPPMARPPPAVPAPVRLRLLFENSRLLRRVQRDEGLRRCWLLLSPELATVADLAAHVAARFRLRRTCPRGVVLSVRRLVISLPLLVPFLFFPLPIYAGYPTPKPWLLHSCGFSPKSMASYNDVWGFSVWTIDASFLPDFSLPFLCYIYILYKDEHCA